jgi:hypothetical protein
MDETNLLSLIRPWLDTNRQITMKFATISFCQFFLFKPALRLRSHMVVFPFTVYNVLLPQDQEKDTNVATK